MTNPSQLPRPAQPTTPEETTCARCRRPVGILWYRGHSTLVDASIQTDGNGLLVVKRHQCPEPLPDHQAELYLRRPPIRNNPGAHGRE